MNDFDQIASNADSGLPAMLGRLQQLRDTGQIEEETVVLLYGYRNKHGVKLVNLQHAGDAVAALGLLTLMNEQLRRDFFGGESYTVDTADEAEG